MKRLVLVLLLVICCSLGLAQSAGDSTKTQKPALQTGFMDWVNGAWKKVQEQGRPAAEKFVRQWPKRFQAVKQEVADLSKTVHDKVVAMDLEQKKNLVIELWRVRKSLDLLTLLQPDVLHSLTGLDTSGLASLETQVQRLIAVVQPMTSSKK